MICKQDSAAERAKWAVRTEQPVGFALALIWAKLKLDQLLNAVIKIREKDENFERFVIPCLVGEQDLPPLPGQTLAYQHVHERL
jgi:hypothetical protein